MKILINREVKNKFQRLSYCDGQITVEINISCKEITDDTIKPSRSIRQVTACYPHTCYDSTSKFIIEVAVKNSLKQFFLESFRQQLEKKRASEMTQYYRFSEEYYLFDEEYNNYQKLAENLLLELGAKSTSPSFSYKKLSMVPFFNPNELAYEEEFPPLPSPLGP
ncbi:hypothetical protein TUM19329_21390 [Legionella antarctica]|uniref:Uncharacterized protein n=1 Tax=Legionella antarctica TaxID=2708020 RepID=A0A6F8T5U6_9GAMM|nr:hypothetical protein [Legionella antarctica]BCA95778.1 hypothetical protein TUM19329_21390 [Legionella antarctica]